VLAISGGGEIPDVGVVQYIYRPTCLQVQDSVRKGIIDMANSNLEKEQLISEVKNHIAIVRYVTGSATGFVRKFLLTCSVLEIFLLARLFVHQSWMACILLVIRH
jgi:hypothetical protein